MSVEPGFDIGQVDVAKVAEIAVEPSYISEITRKLMIVDDEFAGLGFKTALRRVSHAVRALDRENNDVSVRRPEYSQIGGQKESSAKFSMSGDSGRSETTEWRPYSLVVNRGTSIRSVRPEYDDVIDVSVGVNDKLDMIDVVSEMGNVVSENIERISQDHVGVTIPALGTVQAGEAIQPDIQDIRLSDYDSPSVDIIVEGEEIVFVIEVSSRFENPVDKPYIDSKREATLDLEADLQKETFLIVMAPSFTDSVMEKYEDSDIVSLRLLPFTSIAGETRIEVNGFPIVVPDDPEERERAIEGRGVIVGDDYPIVENSMDELTETLERLLRNYHTMAELDYRSQFAGQLTNAVDELLA